MRCRTLFSVLAFLCIWCAGVQAQPVKGIGLNVVVPVTNLDCSRLRMVYESHFQKPYPEVVAQSTAGIAPKVGVQVTVATGWLYLESDWLEGRYRSDTSSVRIEWMSWALGVRQRFLGGAVRAALGQSRLSVTYQGLNRSLFADHVQSNFMLRPGVGSLPGAGFRYNLELGLPVNLILHLFKEGYMRNNGGLADFQITLGMRLPHSHIFWDAGYAHWLGDNPQPGGHWLETFRYGLLVKAGLEW